MNTPREIAVSAAKEAGNLLLQLSKDNIKYKMKNAHDIQAEGDLQSEKIIIERIKTAFPHHSILSEEKGEDVEDKEYLWVIDPIDGTINFARKIEEYAISIALCHKGKIVLGIIYQPTTEKMYAAEKGEGSYLNDKKITVSKENNIINALVATDNTSKMDKRIENYNILTKICTEIRHARIFGSCALHMAKLAEGKLDFYFKTSYNYWDFAAGTILLEEAGGKITDFSGKDTSRNSKNVIASNKVLHKEALLLVSR